MRKSYRGGKGAYNRMRSFCLQVDGRVTVRGVGLVRGLNLRFAQNVVCVFHQINHPILIFIPLSTTNNTQVFLLFSKKNLATKQDILLYLR